MNGKEPKLVITDSDLAMKNAISMVFPSAHHRLYSWHLLRNATAKSQTVEEFGLEHNAWVTDLYEQKHIWSNAYIREKFFAGLKTKSQCEALNMQIGKFIGNSYNLREFIEHFQHYLEFMRRRDLVADYKSAYSEPLVKTKLEVLERYAATIYTKEVFLLFREVLLFSSNVRVVSRKKTTSCTLFEVTMYCQQRCWNVAWAKTEEEFTCSCLHIESFGIPCVYIVGVLVYLNITIIPAMLILERWTKRAKQPTLNTVTRVGEIPDAAYMSMHAAMFDDCRDLIRLSCRHFEYYFELKTRIANERAALREKHRLRAGTVDVGERLGVRDPLCARYKRCGRRAVTSRGKSRRVQRCRKCGNAGHNSRKCRSLFVDGSRDASAATSDWQNVDVVQEEDDMLEANDADEFNL